MKSCQKSALIIFESLNLVFGSCSFCLSCESMIYSRVCIISTVDVEVVQISTASGDSSGSLWKAELNSLILVKFSGLDVTAACFSTVCSFFFFLDLLIFDVLQLMAGISARMFHFCHFATYSLLQVHFTLLTLCTLWVPLSQKCACKNIAIKSIHPLSINHPSIH